MLSASSTPPESASEKTLSATTTWSMASCGAHGLQADALVDVFEGAVGHLDVGAAAQQPHAAGLHIDALVRDPVRGGNQVPVDVGEAEGEPADAHVAHAPAVDHVDALGHLDAGRVRVLVAGQAEVKPAARCPVLSNQNSPGLSRYCGLSSR